LLLEENQNLSFAISLYELTFIQQMILLSLFKFLAPRLSTVY